MYEELIKKDSRAGTTEVKYHLKRHCGAPGCGSAVGSAVDFSPVGFSVSR